MPIGSPLGLSLPEVGVTPGPEWAQTVNDWLQSLGDSVAAGVDSAVGLTITGDVDMEGFALSEVDHVAWENKTGAFTTASALYQRANNLYYNDGSGNQIQLTSGGALNAASLAGIVGDYGGANPAKVTYVDASAAYAFTQDPNVPAKIDVGDLLIRETGATSPNAITLKSPAALAGAYSLTLPTALPPSTRVLTLNSGGTLATSTSITLDSLVLVAADMLHTTRTKIIGALTGLAVSGSWSAPGLYRQAAASGAAEMFFAIPFEIGQRIKTVRVIAQSANAAASDVVAALYKVNAASGGSYSTTTLVAPTNMGGSGTTLRTITLDPADTTLAAGESFEVIVTVDATSGAKQVHRLEVDYDRNA